MKEWINSHPLLGNRVFRSVGIFMAGFVFDVVTLDRVDSVLQNIQQICFLIGVFIVIRWELRVARGADIPAWVTRKWAWKDLLIQFLLGGLLSAYLLFFFKSASIGTSIVFLSLLCGLLILNEFLRTERFKEDMHVTLFATCLTSFWIIIIPTLTGSIRAFYFHAAILVSLGALFLLFRTWIRQMSWKRSLPIFLPPLLLSGFYFLEWIPPVPLAVKTMGVYRTIEKNKGSYYLTYTTPPWYFWRSGDQVFHARPGDTIVLFLRVFAPTGFEDRLQVHWRKRTPKGLESWGKIPLTIVGGRDDGFRGYVTKANYAPGNWIASLHTEDGREVGRLNIRIETDTESHPREFYTRIE